MAVAKQSVRGDTLQIYYGEFMVSPIPLELSFGYCSHKCAYCFANLNKPERWADVKATMRLLAAYQERQSLEAYLLRSGYPVVISNRVDPFAASNYKQALPVMRALTEMGIPVMVQTKGGFGVNEAINWLPPSVWYISVSMLDDDLRRRIEPGAPTIQSRLDLISMLAERGHAVVCGINPCVPAWLPQPQLLIDELSRRGVRGVWIEHLHLNAKQEQALSSRERDALTADLITSAKRKSPDVETISFIRHVMNIVQAAGMQVFSIGQPVRSDFFQSYREIYPRTFPVMQDFVNWCHDRNDTDSLITFEQFQEQFPQALPAGQFRLGHYLGATAHNLWHSHRLSNWMTYTQLVALIWRDGRIKQSPVNIPCFAFAAEKNESGAWVQWLDDNNMPFVLFDPAGFDDYYCEVETIAEGR